MITINNDKININKRNIFPFYNEGNFEKIMYLSPSNSYSYIEAFEPK